MLMIPFKKDAVSAPEVCFFVINFDVVKHVFLMHLAHEILG